MTKFSFEQISHSSEVLDRIIDAYGFTSKLMLADHFGMASSSLAGRYKRGGFPADMVVRCVAETGANLEWIATGNGTKFNDEELDILRVPRKKIIDGQLRDAGILMLDQVIFPKGKPTPKKPICVVDETSQYIIEQQYPEIYDGEWLVDIEGKVSIRTLTRIPVKKVRVSGIGMAFDCSIEDINIIGKVIVTIN
ncbi:phage repressor protein [Jejubacter calystegiae]|uniref:Phage repressor protein n=1 Tax=Jejubacter calystegiae TaxID=2579935 RepID=A0A4P8YFS8_9ENTR|nr:phage repressor protein CI [Jejubacter calystegiae]QCT18508.1 phage repressor protein [Jejubacter calystegiae]